MLLLRAGLADGRTTAPRSHHRTVRTGWAAALAALLAVVGAVGGPVAPAGAVVTEVLPGPVGYFALSTPAPAQAVTLASGTAATLTVAGVGGVPAVADLSAVALNVTVAGPTSSSALRVWANGTTEPTAYAMQFTAAATQSTLVTSTVGSDGKIALKTPAAGSTPVSVVVVGFYAKQQPCYGTGCRYHNRFVPARGTTVYDGMARPGSAGEVLTEATSSAAPKTLTIHGAAGVPATATRAVLRTSVFPEVALTEGTVNVRRADGPVEMAGIVTVTGTSAVSKMVTTRLGSTGGDLGEVEVYVADPAADEAVQVRVVVDVVGYYVGSAYTPVATATDPASVPNLSVAHGAATTFDVRALNGLPHAYSSFYDGAVVFDVSVSGATKAGTVSFGAGVPHVSFAAGQDTSNQVMVPIRAVVGTPTTLSVTYTAASGGTGADSVQVRLTPIGAYQPGSYADPTSRLGDLFTPLAPTQIHTSAYVWDAAGTTVALPVLGVAGVPATGVSRVALQVQSRNNVGATDLRFGPNGRPLTGDPQLTTSGQRASARVVVDVGPDGKVRFEVGALKSTVDVSVVGWYSPYAGNGPQADSVSIYGDSITVQVASDVQAAIEDTHRLGAFALSGFKAEALGWWADSSAASRPDQVVVFLGTNDAFLGGVTAAETRQFVQDQLTAFTTASCRWIVTVNANTSNATYQANADAINAEYRPLPAPGNRLGLIDWDQYVADRIAGGTPATDLIADGIHPTPAGLTALASLYEAAVTGTPSSWVTPCS